MQLFLIPSEPLKGTVTDDVPSPPIKPIQKARNEYKKLLLEHMRAPDGSYEEGLIIPGTTESPARTARTSNNLDTNNPLSLHDEVFDFVNIIEVSTLLTDDHTESLD